MRSDMAYIGDWLGTTPDERKRLEEPCLFAGCQHARYIHGTMRVVRAAWKYFEYTPGKCSSCRCEVFSCEAAISKDEILDISDRFAGDIKLADFGITAACEQKITRWVGEKQTVEVFCRLAPNHAGAHEAR